MFSFKTKHKTSSLFSGRGPLRDFLDNLFWAFEAEVTSFSLSVIFHFLGSGQPEQIPSSRAMQVDRNQKWEREATTATGPASGVDEGSEGCYLKSTGHRGAQTVRYMVGPSKGSLQQRKGELVTQYLRLTVEVQAGCAGTHREH